MKAASLEEIRLPERSLPGWIAPSGTVDKGSDPLRTMSVIAKFRQFDDSVRVEIAR